MAKKINKLLAPAVVLAALSAPATAKEIETNTAKLQAMDKITGRVNVIEAPVNAAVRFGSFSIVVRACKTRPPEETPDNYAFVDVVDIGQDNQQQNIFKGWMISSSPALNAVEHPIYDVWLLQCINTEVDKSKLLNAEQLKARDEIPAEDSEPENLIPVTTPEDIVSEEKQAEAPAAETAPAPSVPAGEQEIIDDGAPESLINISEETLTETPVPADVTEGAQPNDVQPNDGVTANEEEVPADSEDVSAVTEVEAVETEAEPENVETDVVQPATETVPAVPAENASTDNTVVYETGEADALISDGGKVTETEDARFIEFSVEEEDTSIPELKL
ncbi:MAG: DUF2155 domain-containing protein [Pseudomonadota bacterium]|nr:DUF2155 domain-containing protein [Pseudomonadota bacterium]